MCYAADRIVRVYVRVRAPKCLSYRANVECVRVYYMYTWCEYTTVPIPKYLYNMRVSESWRFSRTVTLRCYALSVGKRFRRGRRLGRGVFFLRRRLPCASRARAGPRDVYTGYRRSRRTVLRFSRSSSRRGSARNASRDVFDGPRASSRCSIRLENRTHRRRLRFTPYVYVRCRRTYTPLRKPSRRNSITRFGKAKTRPVVERHRDFSIHQ